MDNNRKIDGFENQKLHVFPPDIIRQMEDDPLFSSIMVTDIGYFPLAKFHQRNRPEGSDSGILLLCGDGQGCCTIEGVGEFELTGGQGILIPKGVAHSYRADEETPWSLYWVHVRGALLDRYLPMVRGFYPLQLAGSPFDQVVRLFDRCFRLLELPHGRREYFYLCQMMGDILGTVYYFGTNPPIANDKNQQMMDHILRYMRRHIRDPLTLSQLAEEAGFSVSRFSQLFSQKMGASPVDYFLQMKIQEAAKELYFTDHLVSFVATEYGFSDPYYFSRLFKKIMGISPKKYQNGTTG